jgi:hypothetical protein
MTHSHALFLSHAHPLSHTQAALQEAKANATIGQYAEKTFDLLHYTTRHAHHAEAEDVV